jgi:catabolite regulation protein CreA
MLYHVSKADVGREVKVTVASIGDVTEVVETIEPESENSIELQQTGCQSILDNFKMYVEEN